MMPKSGSSSSMGQFTAESRGEIDERTGDGDGRCKQESIDPADLLVAGCVKSEGDQRRRANGA